MQAAINGIDLTYSVSGSSAAPAVVLHHPLATDLSVWDELAEALESDYRVVRFDARGHGRSSAPKGPYTFETLSSDVIGLMDHLGIAKAHFLGLSMGGMVGQYLGLLHPARFHSLCLVSTASAVPKTGAGIWEDRIRSVSEGGMSTVVDGAMMRWVAPDALQSRPELVSRLRGLILATPPDGYTGWCHAIKGLDLTAQLSAIDLPTRVIVGALDPATPPAAALEIQKHIPGADLIEMPGVSHMLQVEAPLAFLGHVRPFLAAHGPSA